jgi:hypothetical protein
MVDGDVGLHNCGYFICSERRKSAPGIHFMRQGILLSWSIHHGDAKNFCPCRCSESNPSHSLTYSVSSARKWPPHFVKWWSKQCMPPIHEKVQSVIIITTQTLFSCTLLALYHDYSPFQRITARRAVIKGELRGNTPQRRFWDATPTQTLITGPTDRPWRYHAIIMLPRRQTLCHTKDNKHAYLNVMTSFYYIWLIRINGATI